MSLHNEILKCLVDMRKNNGINFCILNQYEVRIVKEDDIDFIVTMDLNFNRINLIINNDIITNCNIG